MAVNCQLGNQGARDMKTFPSCSKERSKKWIRKSDFNNNVRNRLLLFITYFNLQLKSRNIYHRMLCDKHWKYFDHIVKRKWNNSSSLVQLILPVCRLQVAMTADTAETEPALGSPKPKTGDQVTSVIGEVGRWQLQKILIVFLASAPGQYLTEVKILQSERRPLLGFFLGWKWKCLLALSHLRHYVRQALSHINCVGVPISCGLNSLA